MFTLCLEFVAAEALIIESEQTSRHLARGNYENDVYFAGAVSSAFVRLASWTAA